MSCGLIAAGNAGWRLPPSLRYGATTQFRFAVNAASRRWFSYISRLFKNWFSSRSRGNEAQISLEIGGGLSLLTLAPTI